MARSRTSRSHIRWTSPRRCSSFPAGRSSTTTTGMTLGPIARLAAAIVLCASSAGDVVLAQAAGAGSKESSSTLSIISSIEDARAPASGDVAVLIDALGGPLRLPAIQALGRLQRRDVIAALLPYLTSRESRGQTAIALTLALRGAPLEAFTVGQQEQAVLDAMLSAGVAELASADPANLPSISRSIGHLAIVTRDQFDAAERFLREVLEKPFPRFDDAPHGDAARGLEALVRLNRKIASLTQRTIDRLRLDASTTDPHRSVPQRNALAA